MSSERHVPVYLEAGNISRLPMHFKIASNTLVHIDYATNEDLPSIHSLVRDCSGRGDNVGIGEFDDYDTWHEKIIGNAWAFTIKQPQTKALEGALILRPSRHGRSIVPGTVEFFLHLNEKLGKKRETFTEMFKVAEEFAKELKLNYFACVYCVFMCNIDMVLALRDLGYITTAVIPLSGEVKGVGVIETLVMTKIIGPLSEMLSKQELEQFIIESGIEEGEEYFKSLKLPKVPNLPQEFISENGTNLYLRNMEEKDQRWIYDTIMEAAAKSDGYSIDEHPRFQLFKEWVFSKSYAVVVELANTKERVGYVLMSNSAFNRGTNPLLCDTNLVVDPKFKGMGIGNDLVELWIGFCKELGYKSIISDVVITNWKTMAMARRKGFVLVGGQLRSCFMKGVGWTDSLLVYQSLEHRRTFTEVKQGRKKAYEGKQSNAKQSKL